MHRGAFGVPFSPNSAAGDRPRGWRLRSAIAAVLTAAIAVLGFVLPTAAVAAPTPTRLANGGVELVVSYGGEEYDGTTVVQPGVDYTLSLQYDLTVVEPGSSVTITVPEGVVFPDGVPQGNENITKIEQTGDRLTLTFSDDFGSNQQGYLDMAFRFTEPESGSVIEEITWKLDGKGTSQTVIVRDPGDEFRPDLSDGFGKRVGSHRLNGAVVYSEQTGRVSLAAGATSIPIPYTLTIDSARARTNATVSDTISEYLAVDAGSFTAKLTTWDEHGLNRTTESFPLPAGQPTIDGRTFTIAGIDVPEQSILVISYTAAIAPDQADALVAALQAKADAVSTVTGGGFSVQLGNTATIDGGSTSTGATAISGTKPREPQPGPGSAFTKQSDLREPYELDADGDGTLELPVELDYTFRADLRQYDAERLGYDSKYALTSDVIITDTLPEGLEWTGAVAAGAAALSSYSGSAAGFAAESAPGDFLIDGRTLRVNIGRDVSKTWSVVAGARIVSVDRLPKNTRTGNPQIAETYAVKNSAKFTYSDGRGAQSHTASKNNTLTVRQPDGSVIDDPSEFDKTVGALPQMQIGQAYRVPYSFRIAAGAVVDLGASRIIDTVNHEVFDVTESTLPAIRESIVATYAGTALTPDDFALSLERDELVVELSDAGRAKLGHSADRPLAGALALTLTLSTRVIHGKQTLDVSNIARVVGETTHEYTWKNDATGSATSFGNELEVRKSVYRGGGEWTQNLRVPLDEHGAPTRTEFIYRVQLLPHGSFAGRAILPIVDVLPVGARLVGFVEDADLESGSTRSDTEIDIAGNLRVTLDARANTVVVAQKPGTTLPNAQPYVNFKIELTHPQADIPVVNRIGGTQAVITPSNGFPLLVQKADARRPDVLITDRAARFTVTGPDGTVVTDRAFVVNGQLMVRGESGAETAIVIPEVEKTDENPDGVPFGDYTITETRAPAGYELFDGTVTATIRPDGSSTAVTVFDEPSARYAIGDRTWIDTNRDGEQGADEPALPGVRVELLDAAGEPVRDEAGDPVATRTDDAGYYLFDLLPAGEYRVRFTLTEEQAAQYAFTKPRQGGAATDSDADPRTGTSGAIVLDERNTQLVSGDAYPHGTVRALHGVDPTWDAGVVQQSFAIGDVTWIDANRNGLQDAGEERLAGVRVELTDPAGEPVRHIDGSAVVATTTDDDGFYLFDELPAGEYRVRFTLTDAQSNSYVFTRADANADDEHADPDSDSDAVASTSNRAVGTTGTIVLGDGNEQLTADYERHGERFPVQATQGVDPTWDAGVIARSYAVGDRVWIDENRDGLQGPKEPALEGVTVKLTDLEGRPVQDVHGDEVAPVQTDAHGNYVFDELPAGEYLVEFVLTEDQAEEFRFTEQHAATDDSNADSDADPKTGITTTIVLGPKNPNLTADSDPAVAATDGIDPTWDAGVVRRTYAVGDFTWIDSDRDGVQDSGEPVLAGVRVELLDGTGRPVLDGAGDPVATVTDADGRYLFDELPAGEYRLRFALTEEQAKQYTFTTQGTNGADDSDAVRGTGLTAVFRLDGASDALVPGSEYAFGTVTATEGIDPTWDAGVVVKTYAIGDYTWIDGNRNGLQDADEPVLDGVTVELLDGSGAAVLDADGEPVATVTDENGRYLFDGLPAGDYRVRFTLTPEQAKRYVFTDALLGFDGLDSDARPVDGAPAVGVSRVFSLNDENSRLTLDYDRELTATEGIDPTWDAGVVLARVSVGDTVWLDENGDGTQDAGEPGIPDVVLVITGPDGRPVVDVHGDPVGQVTTDANGKYLFPDLPVLEDGQHYTVSIDREASARALDGLLPTIEGAGDRATDSSRWIAISTGLTTDGEADLTLDFGFVREAPEIVDPPVKPEHPDAPNQGNPDSTGLPTTGGSLQAGLIGGAAILLAAGGALLLLRRRRAAGE